MKNSTKLLSLFLTVAILITSMVFVVPTTALEDDAIPTNSTNSANAGAAVVTEPQSTGYWSEYMSYSFANGVRLGQSGYGTEKNPYPISTAEELAYFAWVVNKGPGYNMTGKYFALTADIDLSAHMWEPIAKAYSGNYDFDGDGKTETFQMTFAGVFDGSGYTIRGLNFHDGYLGADGKLPAEFGGLALFGTLRGASAAAPAKIRNLTVEGSASFSSYSYTTSQFGGPIAMVATAAYANVEISNVNVVTDIDVIGAVSNFLVAGLLGYQTAGAVVENCTVSGNVSVDSSSGGLAALAGGLVARANGTASILNCTNNANVTVTTTSNTALAGGFVAKNESNTATDAKQPFAVGLANLLTISGCVNNGNVVINNRTGGSGTIMSAAGAAIGIAGAGGVGDTYVVNCVNTGLIKVDNLGAAGGVAVMVGVQRTNRVGVESCYSTTEPKCVNEPNASRNFKPSFIYTEGLMTYTNGKEWVNPKWLTPDSCVFMPETAVTTEVGAALRLNPTRDEVASIRFVSSFDEDFLKIEQVQGKKLTYGTILVNADAAREAVKDGVLTTKDLMKNLSEDDYRMLDALEMNPNAVTSKYDPHNLENGLAFCSILSNIRSENYGVEYLPISYVTLTLDAESGLKLTLYSESLTEVLGEVVADEERIVSVREIAGLYYQYRSDVQDSVFANEVGADFEPDTLGKYSPFTAAQLAIFKLYMTIPVETPPEEEPGGGTPDVIVPDVNTDMEESNEGVVVTPEETPDEGGDEDFVEEPILD